MEQRERPEIACLQDGEESMHAIPGGELDQHRAHRTAAESPTPMLAREFVGNQGDARRLDRGLHITGQFAAGQANHPVEPLLGAVPGLARFQPGVALRKPGLRGQRRVLEFVDGRVAKHAEHLAGMRGHQRLQRTQQRCNRFHGGNDGDGRSPTGGCIAFGHAGHTAETGRLVKRHHRGRTGQVGAVNRQPIGHLVQ